MAKRSGIPGVTCLLVLFVTAACTKPATPPAGSSRNATEDATPVPKRIAHPLLDSAARAFVCTNIGVNSIAAYGANKADIEKLASLNAETADTKEVDRLSQSLVRMRIAQQIDFAINLQSEASPAMPKNVGAAWIEYGPALAEVAKKKWETAEFSESEVQALEAVAAARLIDAMAAFTELVSVIVKGQVADAYSANLETIMAVTKKDWKTHRASNVEWLVLDQLTKAYAIDLAGAFLALPPGTPIEIVKTVEANRGPLDSLSKKAWQSNEIQHEEDVALCQTLRAYMDTVR